MEKYVIVTAYSSLTGYSVAKNYCAKLSKLKLTPIIVPYTSMVENYLPIASGILLTGGGDLSESLLKEKLHEKADDIDFARDCFEAELIKKAEIRKIPMLGICRGAQIINAAMGGKTKQHIYGHIQDENRNIASHCIYINKNSRLYDILGKDKIEVNSFHHQAICEVGKNLSSSATSKDGVIEAIESKNNENFIIGVQWHPECMNDIYSQRIFSAFSKEIIDF